MSIYIDFLEKLKIPLKNEPQSVHWPCVEITAYSGILKKDSNKEDHYLSDDLIQDHAFSNLVLDEKLEDINHDQIGMKYLEGVFLERKFDFDNLYTIPMKPNCAFFFRESVVFPSVQLDSKTGHFELTNEDLLVIN